MTWFVNYATDSQGERHRSIRQVFPSRRPIAQRLSKHQARGIVARAQRAFDGRGQTGLDPVPGEEQIAPAGLRRGAQRVLIRGRGKGGALFLDHLPGGQRRIDAQRGADFAPDLARECLAVFHRFTAARIPVSGSHGTGCTLSAAIAALLARRQSLPDAVEVAKAYLGETLLSSYQFLSVDGSSIHALNQGTHFPKQQI